MRDLAHFLFDCAFHLVNGALDLILGTRFHSLLLVASVCKITSAQGRRRSNAGRARVRPNAGMRKWEKWEKWDATTYYMKCVVLLLRNSRKTGTVSSMPPKGLPSSS